MEGRKLHGHKALAGNPQKGRLFEVGSVCVIWGEGVEYTQDLEPFDAPMIQKSEVENVYTGSKQPASFLEQFVLNNYFILGWTLSSPQGNKSPLCGIE